MERRKIVLLIAVLVLIVAVVLILTRQTRIKIVSPVPTPILPTFVSPLTRADRYCAGGGGRYAIDIPCWRDWDASYSYPPGVNGRPAWKMWTVGKLDGRPDASCMPGTHFSPSHALLDAIFACESTRIATLISSGYTGNAWEIGNEPNWYPQLSEADYAYQFALYRNFIKSLDPTAQIVNGGVNQAAWNWAEWTSGIIALGVSPDVWSVHPYNYAMSTQESEAQVIAFRALVGPQRPIWLTEFGWGTWEYRDPQEIAAYLSEFCGWLNSNQVGVERWFWWGILSGPGGMGSGGLFATSPYSTTNATIVGQTYLACRAMRQYKLYIPIVKG